MIRESVAVAESGSVEDLELQEAALKASNMVDYCIRAKVSGNKVLHTL